MSEWFLFTDAEMGGIGLEYSLLTAYFTITNSRFEIVDSLDLRLKPDDGIYKVNGEALSVNKIDLVEHDKIAMPYKKGGTELYNFLNVNKKDLRFIPVGHGVKGDISHYIDKLVSKGSWEHFVTCNVIDTCSTAQFLKVTGDIIKDQSISLQSLRTYFNIQVDGDGHSAKADTLVSIEVLKSLMKLVQR
jgi:hypothetical protein